MLAIPRSAASIFVPLKLFLAAFAKLDLMEGRGQMQERLYNSCDGLSCYCFLTGRDFPCISQWTRAHFSCFCTHAGASAPSAAGSGLNDFCDIWQKSKSGRATGTVKCNNTCWAACLGLLWQALQTDRSPQLGLGDLQRRCERLILSKWWRNSECWIVREVKTRMQHRLFYLLPWRTPVLTTPGSRKDHLGRFQSKTVGHGAPSAAHITEGRPFLLLPEVVRA